MRDQFRAFLPKDENDFATLWSAAEFTFDANILLDLYGTTSSFNESFFELLDALEGKLFLTHQSALEFYRNRKRILERARSIERSLTEQLSSIPSAFSEDAKEKLSDFIKEQKSSLADFLKNDPIEERLLSLLGQHLTPPVDVNSGTYIEINARYDNLIPPGFLDAKEKEDYKKYGDALMWLQIIGHARLSKKPVILVTAEKKADWWAIENGQITGPRPELGAELYDEAKVDFHLYSFANFMKHAPSFLNTQVHQPSQQSAREIARLEQSRDSIERPVEFPQKMRRSFVPASSLINPFWSPSVSGAYVGAGNSGFGLGIAANDPFQRLLAIAKQNTMYNWQAQNEISQIEKELSFSGMLNASLTPIWDNSSTYHHWQSAEIPTYDDVEPVDLGAAIEEPLASPSEDNDDKDDEEPD